MTWIGKSLGFIGYASAAALSAWVAYKVTQERFQWDINALYASDDRHEERIDAQDAHQRFLERQIMDKLTAMHGDIREVKGRLDQISK